MQHSSAVSTTGGKRVSNNKASMIRNRTVVTPVSAHNDEHVNEGSEAKHQFRVAYVDKM